MFAIQIVARNQRIETVQKRHTARNVDGEF